MRRASLMIFAALALLAAPVGDSATAAPAKVGEAAPPPAKPARAADLPPMVFFVARGEADACGRNCAEWIAAEGTVDLAAPQRLRALLDRLGRRKLPIYFHSPGGSITGALAIGRVLRERGMTAGIGWTVPQGCDPKVAREPACDKLKRSGRELPAQLDAGHTMCNSACVYAFVGAAVRRLAPGASLGIHSSSFSFIDRNGRASVRPSPTLLRATVAQSYALVEHYLGDMGIDPELLTAARRVASDHIRFLTRAEVRRFNIDRRSFVESEWTMVGEPTRAVRKIYMDRLTDGGEDFRTTLILLSCGQPDRLRLVLAREVVPGDGAAPAGITIAARGSVRVLKPGRRTTLSSTKTEYDVGSIEVQAGFLLDAGESIALSTAAETELPTPDPAPAPSAAAAKPSDHPVTLATVGLGASLAKLLPTCAPAFAKPEVDWPAAKPGAKPSVKPTVDPVVEP
jgi:hypothetical protein